MRLFMFIASAAIVCGGLLVSPVASAQTPSVQTKTVTYTHNGRTCHGYVAWDDAVEGERPGVLVCHEWWGQTEYARRRARQIAELGYVAFAVDMYGNGRTADTRDAAQSLASALYQDRTALRDLAAAGLMQLRDHDLVDDDRLAAIGYCMGGTVALELARSGADVDAVVVFHGGLSTPDPSDNAHIGGEVLICNGAADPLVSDDERRAFTQSLEEHDVPYTFINYGGAVHSFTNPGADAHDMDAVRYDRRADERSWRHMQVFLDETLGEER